MVKTFMHSRWDNKIVQVSWDLGNECNQNCSYCPDVFKNGHFSNGNWDQVEIFADRMCDYYDLIGKSLYIGFGGSGEPTLVPWFGNLLRLLNNRIAGCTVSTNLTAPLEWFEEHGNVIKHISGTVHYEYTSLPELADKICAIRDVVRDINITVPMLPDRYDEQIKDIEWFSKKTNINVGQQVVFSNPVEPVKLKKEYTEEIKENLRSTHDNTAYLITTKDENNVIQAVDQIKYADINLSENDSLREFTNWDCYAGIDTLVIDSRGFVRRGWCAQLSMHQHHMTSWSWNLNPITCNMKW